MRTPHHCCDCGSDLTRILARIDDVLRLPLVRCPGCGRVQARRPLRRRRARRRLIRGIVASIVFVVQLGLLIVATVTTGSAAMLLVSMVDDFIAGGPLPLEELVEDLPGARYLPFLVPAAMFAVAGIWHGITFAHLLPKLGRLGSMILSTLAFLLWVQVWLLAVPFLDAMGRAEPPLPQDVWTGATAGLGLAGGAPFLLLGSALGRAATSARVAARRTRWRKRLSQRRITT